MPLPSSLLTLRTVIFDLDGTLIDSYAAITESLNHAMVAHQKPHPEMIEAALAALGARREEAVYVGDMEVDVQAARAAGLPVVVLPTGSCSAADLKRAGADLLLPSFTALLDLLPGPLPESRLS
jgi:phosphoglycolate phosphatase-like HAD superfamily hydrolase